MLVSYLTGKKILVTGGASFIGSHLVDELKIKYPSSIVVADDMSSGKWRDPDVELLEVDLRNQRSCEVATKNIDVVFHLAADHGGRGYVDTHEAECAGNLAMDANMILASRVNGIETFVYASSGCVYPNYKQTNVNEDLYLKEEDVGPPYDPDHVYGWAKLSGEMMLKAYCERGWISGSSLRYFTVYGPRGKEDHAVIAMMARALIRQKPFEIWGDGSQIRNWTHVDDIVEGTILAVEELNSGIAVNLGTEERISVIQAAQEICEYAGHTEPFFEFQEDKPTGPLNRTASNELARRLMGWQPQIMFSEGIKTTYDWYENDRDINMLREELDSKLFTR